MYVTFKCVHKLGYQLDPRLINGWLVQWLINSINDDNQYRLNFRYTNNVLQMNTLPFLVLILKWLEFSIFLKPINNEIYIYIKKEDTFLFKKIFNSMLK